MMEIFEAFVTYLLSYTTLAAVVGNNIFPDCLPEDHKGAGIVYQAIGGSVEYTLQGRDGMKCPQYQFSCYGDTNKEAYSAYKQLVKAFDEAPATMSDLDIQFVEQVSEPIKDFEANTKRHSYKVDFQFYFTE